VICRPPYYSSFIEEGASTLRSAATVHTNLSINTYCTVPVVDDFGNHLPGRGYALQTTTTTIDGVHGTTAACIASHCIKLPIPTNHRHPPPDTNHRPQTADHARTLPERFSENRASLFVLAHVEQCPDSSAPHRHPFRKSKSTPIPTSSQPSVVDTSLHSESGRSS
jgi:hypothetical protein